MERAMRVEAIRGALSGRKAATPAVFHAADRCGLVARCLRRRRCPPTSLAAGFFRRGIVRAIARRFRRAHSVCDPSSV
jgi:hypothetical protein